jgi:hypothetical protein
MALARVVTFEGVDRERVEALRQQIGQGGPPEGLPASEIILLTDLDAGRAQVILFFDSEEDYRRGDEVLQAMPSEETPGRRTGVAKYEVAVRATVCATA